MDCNSVGTVFCENILDMVFKNSLSINKKGNYESKSYVMRNNKKSWEKIALIFFQKMQLKIIIVSDRVARSSF